MSRRFSSPHPELVEGRGRNLARRSLILGAGASALAVGFAQARQPVENHITPAPSPEADLAAIQSRMGGKLGVHVHDLQTHREMELNADARFPMCSTFKLSLAAAVLEAVDQSRVHLDQKLAYTKADLLDYAPITRAHVATGALSVSELCRATVELSDNTAANLLLTQIGGPAAMTARWRAWGDRESRLDRNEPTLNTSIPGDPRDTTTPRAMGGTLRSLLTGAVLKPASRDRLLGWMYGCQTGLHKLRAGLPAGLTIGDKTGNSGKDTMGDLAIVEAVGRQPILITCYLTEAKVDAGAQDAVFAAVGRWVGEWFPLKQTHG